MADFSSDLPTFVKKQLETPFAGRLLQEYGAVFVAKNGVTPPDRLIFQNEQEVSHFQGSVDIGHVTFEEFDIELQEKAADSLTRAIDAARSAGLTIGPRASDSGRRSYADTVELWASRIEPGLEYWVALGRLPRARADVIRSFDPFDQVPVILKLEDDGLYFAKDLSKSVLYSVAPPGTSQHISMLAFDVAEFDDERVREILAEHFWYQTVVSDLPHFTYLGVPESELEPSGLKPVDHSGRRFWVPDL